jgi:hypothetical protein
MLPSTDRESRPSGLSPDIFSSSRFLTEIRQMNVELHRRPRNWSAKRRSKSSLRTPSFDSPAGFALFQIEHNLLIIIAESPQNRNESSLSSGECGLKSLTYEKIRQHGVGTDLYFRNIIH